MFTVTKVASESALTGGSVGSEGGSSSVSEKVPI